MGPVLTGAAPGAAARARRLWPRAITSMRPGCEETAAGDAEVCPAARGRPWLSAGAMLAAAPHGEQLWPRTKMPRGAPRTPSSSSRRARRRRFPAGPLVPSKAMWAKPESCAGTANVEADGPRETAAGTPPNHGDNGHVMPSAVRMNASPLNRSGLQPPSWTSWQGRVRPSVTAAGEKPETALARYGAGGGNAVMVQLSTV